MTAKLKRVVFVFENDESASLEDSVAIDFVEKRVVISRPRYQPVVRKPDIMPSNRSALLIASDYLYKAREGKL